jgi:hypothetical protein
MPIAKHPPQVSHGFFLLAKAYAWSIFTESAKSLRAPPLRLPSGAKVGTHEAGLTGTVKTLYREERDEDRIS